jgi:hypothetical protein
VPTPRRTAVLQRTIPSLFAPNPVHFRPLERNVTNGNNVDVRQLQATLQYMHISTKTNTYVIK